jgi:hypothetical protein
MADDQSVYLGVEPTLGLVTRYYFPSESCCLKVTFLFLWGALSDERTGVHFSVKWSKSRRTRNHTSLSHLRLPQPGGSDSGSCGQHYPALLVSKLPFRVHEVPQLELVLRSLILPHTFTLCKCKIHFNIIILCTRRFVKYASIQALLRCVPPRN